MVGKMSRAVLQVWPRTKSLIYVSQVTTRCLGDYSRSVKKGQQQNLRPPTYVGWPNKALLVYQYILEHGSLCDCID